MAGLEPKEEGSARRSGWPRHGPSAPSRNPLGQDRGGRAQRRGKTLYAEARRWERCVLSSAHLRFTLELLDPLQNLGLAQHTLLGEQFDQGVQRERVRVGQLLDLTVGRLSQGSTPSSAQ